jgi:AcrR family transcriptional regulator
VSGVTGDGDEWEGRRADARRNHERVLAAAVEVFTEHGLDATIPQVAERAGVGKATVYRSYPTKADLVEALALQQIDWLRSRFIAAGAGMDDPYATLESLLHEIVTRLAEDRLMVQLLGAVESWQALAAPGAEHDRPVISLVAAAVERGQFRADATIWDLQVLVGGAAHALIENGERDPAVWRRYASLAMRAMRP